MLSGIRNVAARTLQQNPPDGLETNPETNLVWGYHDIVSIRPNKRDL